MDAHSIGRNDLLRLCLPIDNIGTGLLQFFALTRQQLLLQHLLVFVLDPAESAYHMTALLIDALLMYPEVVGVGVRPVAVTAHKGPV